MIEGCEHILVTGGMGFIGRNLVRRLLKVNVSCRITIIDDLSSGTDDADLRGDPRINFLHEDVCNVDPKRAELASDIVFHLACPASPPQYQSNQLKTFDTAVRGTRAILEVAQMWDARVVVASTSEVYGDPLQHPQNELYYGNVNSLGPRACYDEGKRSSETLCYLFRNSGVDVRIARIFNTYGPRMRLDDGRVVSNFITQALLGKPLTIFGDGSQTRSFCYVEDLVTGLLSLARLEEERSGGVPTCINLGNPSEFTLLELAEIVESVLGDWGRVFCPLPVDDPQRRKPDITRAKHLLSWSPSISLADGVAITAQFFRSEISSLE